MKARKPRSLPRGRRTLLAASLALGLLGPASVHAQPAAVATAPAASPGGFRPWMETEPAPAARKENPGTVAPKAVIAPVLKSPASPPRPPRPALRRERPAASPPVASAETVASVPVPAPAPAALAVPPAPPVAPAPSAAPSPAAPPVIQVILVLEPTTARALAAMAEARAGTNAVSPPILVAGPLPKGALSAAPKITKSADAASPADQTPAVPAPPPYSLPWQLRPAVLGNVGRLDTVLASDRAANGKPGVNQVAMLLASRKLTANLMPLLRLGGVRNQPASGDNASVLLNPLLGLVYGAGPAPFVKAAGFFGTSLPLGTGAGNDATAGHKAALKTGGGARSGMDGAMFAVNDLGFLLGGDVAYVRGGLTVQLETTLIELVRVRGKNAQPDAQRLNLTSGLHLGYFVVPQISLGSELRYQRWLSTPAAVAADASGASRDTLTAAAGVRLHARIGQSWVRPGLSLSRALDKPLSTGSPTVVQIDLPVAF